MTEPFKPEKTEAEKKIEEIKALVKNTRVHHFLHFLVNEGYARRWVVVVKDETKPESEDNVVPLQSEYDYSKKEGSFEIYWFSQIERIKENINAMSLLKYKSASDENIIKCCNHIIREIEQLPKENL